MSNIDKRGLREAAEKATKGRWAVEFDDEIYSTDGVNHEQIAMVFSENEARDAAFIAAANPTTVLALLASLEAAEKRIAELEARAFNPAILDVVAERQRQQSVEGWTPEHDNAYQNSELADAAACYAIHAHNQGFSTPAHWPWSPDWWKQSGARCDLVKAGALILAEIERIDRQEAK
ncbi:ead/Ea22-like family protein [Escherichia coli]|nr:ead/Ea22-like family protein [Escherichia coli]EFM2441050.1 ead/Ea22-like family protein [Escherichia coli]EHC2659936.1 ead/Ea22-like family protein [Escherichia coli]